MSNEPIFRFTAFRAAKEKLRKATTRTRFNLFTPETETAFHSSFMQATAAGASRAQLVTLAESLKNTPRYIRELRALPLDVIPLLAWAAKNANELIEGMLLASEFESLYQMTLGQLASSDAFRDSRDALADTILADALSGRREPHIEDVTTAFKLLTLGDRTARGEVLPFEGRFGDFIAKVTIIVPRILGPLRPRRPQAEQTTSGTVSPEPDPTREHLQLLAIAHRELTQLALDVRSMTEDEPRAGRRRRVAQPAPATSTTLVFPRAPVFPNRHRPLVPADRRMTTRLASRSSRKMQSDRSATRRRRS